LVDVTDAPDDCADVDVAESVVCTGAGSDTDKGGVPADVLDGSDTDADALDSNDVDVDEFNDSDDVTEDDDEEEEEEVEEEELDEEETVDDDVDEGDVDEADDDEGDDEEERGGEPVVAVDAVTFTALDALEGHA
jgi:hypothetical protein